MNMLYMILYPSLAISLNYLLIILQNKAINRTCINNSYLITPT